MQQQEDLLRPIAADRLNVYVCTEDKPDIPSLYYWVRINGRHYCLEHIKEKDGSTKYFGITEDVGTRKDKFRKEIQLSDISFNDIVKYGFTKDALYIICKAGTDIKGIFIPPVELKKNKLVCFNLAIIKGLHTFLRILHGIPTYTELDSMDKGWRKKFGIQMCKEIKAELKKNNLLYKYRIEQIKEKFGSLRWYDSFTTKEIQNIISKYESISAETCIVCGKPATQFTTGWICPYCDEHVPEGRKTVDSLTKL